MSRGGGGGDGGRGGRGPAGATATSTPTPFPSRCAEPGCHCSPAPRATELGHQSGSRVSAVCHPQTPTYGGRRELIILQASPGGASDEGFEVRGHWPGAAQVARSGASLGVTLGKSVPRFAPGAPEGERRRGLQRAPGMPHWGRQRFPAELALNQEAVRTRHQRCLGWVGAGPACAHAGECEPAPGLGLSSVPQTHALPLQSQVQNWGATSLKASGAEPLPHHVIA